MADQSDIYQKIRCPKCEHRLNKPMLLNCQHSICQKCLETILRNHRTNACCPACKKSLDEYQIENYSFLPLKHYVAKLLASFTDVNQCETCKTFTDVEPCSQCQQDQCESCRNQHEKKHMQLDHQSSQILDELLENELEILQAIRKDLTEQEFDDLLRTAKMYLNDAISKSTRANTSNDVISKGIGSSVFNETTSEFDLMIESMPKAECQFFSSEATEVYDWSKHPKITADDILNTQPERVMELLRLNFLPRPYQIRMIQPGLKHRNTLICLQTGAGKTFVAGMVAKFFYIVSQQNALLSPSARSRRFKAVFLVPIKALVDQQCEAFRKVFIDESETILKTIDNQVGERFKDLCRQFDIFFFTVQKFANFVESKHADLTKFDLLMIDECHHCYDNHPINSMMRQYHRLKLSGCDVPQIIALTGSVGTHKKNAFAHLVHLCANLDCMDICAIEPGDEEDELRRSTNTPLADTIVDIPKREDDSVVGFLKNDVMKAIASRLGYDLLMMDNQKAENFLVQEHQAASKNGDRDVIIGTDYLRLLNRFLLYYEDLPLDQCIKWFDESLEESKASKPTEFDAFCQKKIREFRQFVTKLISVGAPVKAKLQKLIVMIIALHTPGSRGLVLVRTKFHTVALEEFLNKRPELMKQKIAVGHLTGQGSAEELCLPGTQQATVLKEFRKGTKSLLVATDVAQEGIDVAECSYVIRYEFVSNEIGSVQSRGRARAAQSKCFLITETLSINHQRELENRQKEAEMKEALNEWRRKGTREFQRLVGEEQDGLEKELCRSDSVEPSSPVSPSNAQSAQTIHCRFCEKLLCEGSRLRLQGTTVVCVDAAFEKLINPPKTAGAKFVCPNPTCHRELGVVILLPRSIPAYALQITAVKFFYRGDKEARLFKKWSLYQGHLEPL